MRKQVFLTSLAVTVGLFLSACAGTTQGELDSLKSEIATLEDKVLDLESKIGSLELDVEFLNSDVVYLEGLVFNQSLADQRHERCHKDIVSILNGDHDHPLSGIQRDLTGGFNIC